MVVHGLDGIDEISVSARTHAVTIGEDGTMHEQTIDPIELGVRGHSISDLAGGDADDNSQIARDILSGGGPPAVRDAVALNAGAALSVYGVASDLADGVARVRAAMDDGTLARFVDEIVAGSQKLAERAAREAAEGAA
jgi:anthranilate phosphoribosyltransferase